MKIILANPQPPIPDRSFDWCVYEDGHEEDGDYGWGRTPLDALVSFITRPDSVGYPEYELYNSPLVAALKRALAVMDEPLPDTIERQAECVLEQQRRIEGDIKEALRMLGEPI